ncbi:hypothetical protein BBF96_13700 [Anoxybacter fermentans]|uniref:Uncharacterized protein n=1 Tax=Anoxybacter fermentans TaxID=1323375 RepID=A0A3Q9HSG6_9FIRM|nr:hypothetical protein [Anoxybacter fermentans]AZR74348.1 hypothetical protein BBF96_13700 [Anoxybacter fermentans]
MIRKPYFGENRVSDGSKNFSRSEKLAFCSLTNIYLDKNQSKKGSTKAFPRDKEKQADNSKSSERSISGYSLTNKIKDQLKLCF